MKNRKNQNKYIWLFACYLFLFNISTTAEALATKPKLKQTAFTLEVTENHIYLKANQASVKGILNDLEKKTDIEVKIFDGVYDKAVTLSISDLPVHSVHSLLEKMGVENFAVIYDQQLASKIIYILPAGKNISEIVKDKTKTILFSTHIINVDVAQLVAEDYLPKYYPGNWVYFDSFILYDLEGIPAAYAIVFRDTNSKITTFEELNSTIKEIRVKRDQRLNQLLQIQETKDLSANIKSEKLASLEKMTNKLKRALYQSDSFATVVTGATVTSSLLIRCYRGLPSFIVKRADIEAELTFQYPNKKLQLGRVIYFNPIDIRYEVTKEVELREGKLAQPISDDSYLVSIAEDKIKLISVASERQMHRQKIVEQENLFKKMSSENKQRLEESENKKKQHYKTRWVQYKKRI